MNKTIKIDKLFHIYKVLNGAKYGKLSDEDKIKVFKIVRTIKPEAVSYEEANKDAVEKMKPENFDEMVSKAQEYERKKNDGEGDLPISDEQYDNFVKQLKDYNRLVADAIKDLSEKEFGMDIEPLSEDAFGKLMASNDWTMEQALAASEAVCM